MMLILNTSKENKLLASEDYYWLNVTEEIVLKEEEAAKSQFGDLESHFLIAVTELKKEVCQKFRKSTTVWRMLYTELQASQTLNCWAVLIP